MYRLFCILGVAVAGLAITAGASARLTPRPPEGGAGKFMKTVVSQKLASKYDLAWESLYPAHQQVASREAYVGCESLIPSSGNVTSVKAVRVFRQRISVAGQPRKLMTRAVRIRVSVEVPYVPFPVVIAQTFHALRVHGSWKWILSPEQYAYYNARVCPYA
jgi:hypothetical protein